MGQQIGRLGQMYVKDCLTVYAGVPVLAATDAFKHLELGLTKSLNRSPSLERRGTPGRSDRFSRHTTAGWNVKKAYLSPSGTIQTAPNARVFLRNGFGSERVGTLSTTVASGPTTGGATLTSVTGLAVKDFVLVNCTGGSFPGRYAVVIKTIVGSAVTWTPALPQAPNAGDTVKQGVTYQPTNTLPALGFDIAHYLTNVTREALGCVVEKLGIMFDGNDEVQFNASGPAQDVTKPAQAQPGAFTAVGSPITGIVGLLYKDGVAIKLTNVNFELNNLEQLINDSFGTSVAEDHYRDGIRDVTIGFEQRQLTATDFYDAAVAASDFQLFVQCGTTEGKIVAALAPRCEIDVPDVPDPDGKIVNSFKGVAKETLAGLDGASTGGNDELIIGIL